MLLFKAPRVLYHYTSIESLIKIFDPTKDSVSLRFTEISHLNDPLEQKYYLQQFNYDNELPQGAFYVFSLSALKDNLEMWRLYAKDATGVAIGFKNLDFNIPLQEPDNLFAPVHLLPCCYGRRNVEEFGRIASHLGMDVNYILSCMFKHECYSHEKEYRLVFHPDFHSQDIYSFHVLSSNCISDIWIGPKSCLSVNDVERIIGKEMRINQSRLPYVNPR